MTLVLCCFVFESVVEKQLQTEEKGEQSSGDEAGTGWSLDRNRLTRVPGWTGAL